jgi:hypothetical protein
MLELTSGKEDSWLTACLLALAALALGLALQLDRGPLHAAELLWLSIAFGLCACGVVMSRVRLADRSGRWEEPLLGLILLLGLWLQLLQLGYSQPALFYPPDTWPPFEFQAALVIVAMLAVLGISRAPLTRPIWFPVVLILHAAIGSWIIESSPRPAIDVFMFQRDASARLLEGGNPYTIQYPNMYGPETNYYGPGLSVEGRLTFGFPYPPLSLLLVMPAHAIAGDLRYAHLAAMIGAGALIGHARAGAVAPLAACLYLFTPRVFFILEHGWTEPLAVLLLALTIFCACRMPHVVPYAYGLLLAVKQYLVFLVPIAYVLARAVNLKPQTILARGLVVATAVTLPFFLWNARPFMDSVVTLQLLQPFRPDSLSYLAWVAIRGGPVLSGAVAFAAAAVALVPALWLTARTPSGAAASVALVYFAFFAFNKQAFANYYLFVVGALCCAVAASVRRGGGRDFSPATRRG